MTTSVNHLEKLAIVQTDFDIWGGKVKLDDPDIKLGIGGTLPPKSLAELGNKKIIDSKHLRPFNRLKTMARRLCLAKGMSFMNGFAVPLDEIDRISSELDEIRREMNNLKTDFMANYDKHISEWRSENTEYSEAITKGVLPAQVIEKKFGFEFTVFQVDPVNQSESQKLQNMASGLSGELMAEIVKESDDFFHKNLKGKDLCQVNTQKTLIRIRDKVEGLSFLDNRFLSIVKLLDITIKGYPDSGKVVTGEPFYRILSAILILSSTDKINDYATGSVDLDDMTSRYMFAENVNTDESKDDNVSAINVEEFPEQNLNEESFEDDMDDDDIDAFFQQHQATADGSFF
ncbi:MAG: DUF3150 domain-containing protein [Candidatus Marinimicrobia bacterium]|nr:DUF3150 domain-containing protein [Candidatus Neomarinimicrobiota bacterium]